MRSRSVLLVAGAFVLTALSACAPGGGEASDAEEGSSAVPITQENVVGSWLFIEGTTPEGDLVPPEGEPVELTFGEDGSVSGGSGCNSIFGTATFEDGRVSFGALGQTMMACAEPAMTFEHAYTQALDIVQGGQVDPEENLVLTGKGVKLSYKAK